MPVGPLLEVVFKREGVPASELHGDLRLAAQTAQLARAGVEHDGQAGAPTPRSIAAPWRSTKLLDRR
jgi:hypothetical protein